MSNDIVSLPHRDLPCSDGSIDPPTPNEMSDLEEHMRSGHIAKSNLCRGCLEAEGPRKIHQGQSVRDVDKATHTLHIDIAGSLPTSDDNDSSFLVGALRLPGLPLAKRSVGLIKSLGARALASANLDQVYWSCAVRYAAQPLLCPAQGSVVFTFEGNSSYTGPGT